MNAPAHQTPVPRASDARKKIAVIGNPNTGKSTLFNALTGMKQRTGNFPGVTVESKHAMLTVDDGVDIELIDLPGTYSLAAKSPDEMLAVDVLLGQHTHVGAIAGVLAILDASNLQRNLYLVSQILECELPLVLVLNMHDVALTRGVKIDARLLSERLGVPVIITAARRGEGVDDVRRVLAQLARGEIAPSRARAALPPALQHAAHAFATELSASAQTTSNAAATTAQTFSNASSTMRIAESLRVLVDHDGFARARLLRAHPETAALVRAWSDRATTSGALGTVEATARYTWIRALLRGVVTQGTATRAPSDRLDYFLTHKIFGTLILGFVAFVLFQLIYRGAAPIMDGIEFLTQHARGVLITLLPAGMLRDLLTDGVLAGVGSVLAFVPQIALLFAGIALLEDCGYMARAAFLMDRLFARVGLSGKSFIPLLSSFACAVPGIMATRTIENRKDRFATILVAPLMSCSARLPVYALMIGAFIPAKTFVAGLVGVQGLLLLVMHLLGLVVAIPAIFVIKKIWLRGPTPPFVMELPPYRLPVWRVVALRVADRVWAFVRRAGTIILALSIIVWAAAYFPHLRGDASAADQLAQSVLGRLGHFMEPAVAPLGWDWRIGVAVLSAFPAREVIIATLGTIFQVGSASADSGSLRAALQHATFPSGAPLMTIATALSVMVFFALCCQCMATLAVIRRETGHIGYAIGTFCYMTALAYFGAWGIFALCKLF